jgi:tRNA G18 (ribose-2'-O)-methylase SpoU
MLSSKAVKKITTQELVAQKPPLEKFKRQPRNPIYVTLNNVRSLQNVGLCFRVCDAIRAEKLYLTGFTGYPPLGENDPRRAGVIIHAKNQIEKTAIWTVDYVPWEYREDTIKLVKELKRKKVQIVAVEQTHQSQDYLQAPYRFPLVLIMGHEREGIEDPVLNLADFSVETPMYGMGNSLNVAMALSILGYELVKRLKS